MEAPRDDHKLTHNMRLATRDKLFGGTVSRLQVRHVYAACYPFYPWLQLVWAGVVVGVPVPL